MKVLQMKKFFDFTRLEIIGSFNESNRTLMIKSVVISDFTFWSDLLHSSAAIKSDSMPLRGSLYRLLSESTAN